MADVIYTQAIGSGYNLPMLIGRSVTCTPNANSELAIKKYVDDGTFGLSAKSFGAVGDGVTDDTVAILAWIQAVMGPGYGSGCGFLPRGIYRVTQPIVIDMAGRDSNGFTIHGEGLQCSVLDMTPSLHDQPGIKIVNTQTVHNFYPNMSDLCIRTESTAPTMVIGNDDLATCAINAGKFEHIQLFNSGTGGCLRLNFVLQTSFVGLVCPCTAGPALTMRQVQFCSFTTCSFSNGTIGIHFTDGFNYGNVYTACDIEVVQTGIVIDNASTTCTTYIGGNINWIAGGVNATAGAANTFINTNFASNPATRWVSAIGVSAILNSAVVGVAQFQDITAFGTVSKGGGAFDIAHPDPAKPGWRLRHCFVESNTRGDNIYRYVAHTVDGVAEVALPEYFEHLNENPQVFVSAAHNQAHLAFGSVSADLKTVRISANVDSDFNVLVIATRKDALMKKFWDAKGGAEILP